MFLQNLVCWLFGEGLDRFATPETPDEAWTAATIDDPVKARVAKKRKRSSSSVKPLATAFKVAACVANFWLVTSGVQRTLWLPQDQCFIGSGGVYFLQYQYRLAVQEIPDLSHRVTNDLKGVLQDCGLWSAILVMGICWVLM